MNSCIVFNFYGILTRVVVSEPGLIPVLESLKEDLGYFLVSDSHADSVPKVQLSIIGRQREFKRRIPLFRTRMCRVYGLGRERHCDYGEGVTVTSRRGGLGRDFTITGEAFNAVYEVTYLALLSAVGEELDLLGFHRVHALGLTLKGKSVLILLPSGGGKSAMAALLTEQPEVQIFSDEMPLLKNGVLYPFPIRIALNPSVLQSLCLYPASLRVFYRKAFPAKVLFPLKRSQIGRPLALSTLVAGQLRGAPPSFKTSSLLGMGGQLFLLMVLGLGLCQMVEHMLRVDNIFRLLRIVISRVREAVWVGLRCQRVLFYTSTDARENARALCSFFSCTRPELIKAQQTRNEAHYVRS